MTMTRLTAAALALAFAVTIAAAHSYAVGAIKIGHPWAGATPPGAQVGGGYLSIENTGATPVRLIGARTPIADHVEIHTMTMDGGVMRMRMVPSITIAPGANVEFKPGGLHLMLVGLKRPLVDKDKAALTLLFDGGISIDVELHVQANAPVHTH